MSQDLESLFKEFEASTNRDQLLLRIAHYTSQVAAAAPPPVVGLATEVKQDAMIAELIKMLDFEIACIQDTVTGIIYLMNIEKNETTGVVTVTYLDAQGNVVVPPNPGDLVVCDASGILALILAEMQVLTAAVVETPSLTTVSLAGAGSIAAGAQMVSIENTGDVDVTVDGEILVPGKSVGFMTSSKNGATLAAISYVIPGAGAPEILIAKTV